jgi:hypothetical protein
MRIFLASTDPQSDAGLLASLEEVFGGRGNRVTTLVRRGGPEETRASIKTAAAVFGIWSPEDPAAVGELAFAAGAGCPVYVVARCDIPPWFCLGVGQGGYYDTPLRAVAAFLRDLAARRSS